MKTKRKTSPDKSRKLSVTVYLILRIIVMFTLVRSFFRQDYQGVFYCVLTLLLFILPSVLKKGFKIELPSALEAIIFIFIFAAEILGELNSYYLTVPHFDTILHTLNGFICAAFGFGLVDLLNRGKNKISLSPVYLCICAFCFSMTIGVLWEFFEFGMDTLFSTDMQKDKIITVINSVKLNPSGENSPAKLAVETVSVNGQDLGLGGYLDIGLFDTMKDLIVNFLGALVFCVIGFFELSGRKNGKVVENLVPKTLEEEK